MGRNGERSGERQNLKGQIEREEETGRGRVGYGGELGEKASERWWRLATAGVFQIAHGSLGG